MDILSNKAIMIGAGLLASIIVMTGVILAVNQMKVIYGYANKTDISVVKEFDDIFTTYNGADMKGVDLVNTIKRFEGNNQISVEYPGCVTAKNTASSAGKREATYINEVMQQGTNNVYKYEKEYAVTVQYLADNTKMKIVFKEK